MSGTSQRARTIIVTGCILTGCSPKSGRADEPGSLLRPGENQRIVQHPGFSISTSTPAPRASCTRPTSRAAAVSLAREILAPLARLLGCRRHARVGTIAARLGGSTLLLPARG